MRWLKVCWVLFVLVVAASVGACGDEGGEPSTPPSVSEPVPTMPNEPTPTPGALEGACTGEMLYAEVVQAPPAAGQRYAHLTLTNETESECKLSGYVGLQLLTASDQPIPTQVEKLPAPKPAVITLTPDGSAHARLSWTVIPAAGEPQEGACAPTPALLRVTPPGAKTPTTAGWELGMVCGKGHIKATALQPGMPS